MIEVVQRAPMPTLLIDLPDGEIAAASAAAGTLLATGSHDLLIGRRVTDLTTDSLSSQRALALVLEGHIDGYWRGNRVLHRLDGTSVVAEVSVTANPFDSNPRFAVVLGLPPKTERAAGTARGPELVDDDIRLLGVVGPAWQLSQISCTVTEMLGFEAEDVIGRSILDFIHPRDVPELLMTLGSAAGQPRMSRTHLRLLSAEGGWNLCRTHITPLAGADLPSFAFVARQARPAPDSRSLKTRDAQELLLRIAHEMRSVEGEPAGPAEPPAHEASLALLSQREREIVRRLLDGERVPGIAASLVIAQSTVRNHLAAAFKKLGVHSQQELLRRFWT
jgi:DNA-binding CsgD family transcriptional regulator/PAS domain-containing protein